MLSIDNVFEVLSDNTNGRVWHWDAGYVGGEPGSSRYYARNSPLNSVLDNTDVVTVNDFFLGAMYANSGYPNTELIAKSNKILDTLVWFPNPVYPLRDPRNVWTPATERINELKQILIGYAQSVALLKTENDDPTTSTAGAKSLKDPSVAKVLRNIGRNTKEYFEAIHDTKRDISQIGFYSIPEAENSGGFPTVVPSSINIQESLLNQPIPTVRSKSVGVIPDHRSKHIVSIDIIFPNFETFSSTEPRYPSFINLYNMFKFMPINSIYSPALCMAFVSEYTYPRFFDLVKQIYTSEEFDDLNTLGSDTARAASVMKKLGIKSIADIQALMQYDDALLDIGLSAISDSVIGNVPVFGDDSKRKVLDFIPGGQGNGPAQFPVPVSFKSASIQTAVDMPGAVIGRFTFGIVSSPAFPFGNILYRDNNGEPTFNPSECYYGEKYVSIASQKLVDQLEIDKLNILGSHSEEAGLLIRPELGLNDLRLHYFDIADGLFSFDTTNERYSRANGSPVVLEKISGAFNSKTVDLHLMGAKFPTCQYMGLNSNSIQMIFAVTDKKVISDFMAMKARIVDSEKAKTLFNSYAIIENTLVNSLGITRVTPQSLTIESDSDNPELYRLIINFIENYEDLGSKEKLKLEKGVISIKPLEMFWDYLYDLYRIWAHQNKISGNLDPILNPPSGYTWNRRGAITESDLEKLNKLMETVGIKKDYIHSDKTTPTLLNAGGKGAHGVYYGPVLMGIIAEYSKLKNNIGKPTGILEYDFPELINNPFLSRDQIHRNVMQSFGLLLRYSYSAEHGITRPQDYGWFDRFLAGIAATDAERRDIHEKPARILKALVSSGPPGAADILFPDFDHPGQPLSYENQMSAGVNLVDMFHKNGAIIPKPIWDSILEAILSRTHTAGKEVLVVPKQMDRSFTVLHTLVTKYEKLFTFHLVDGETWLTQKVGRDLGIDDIIATLDLKKMKEIQKDTNAANNQIINLYPDMYLPTYNELMRDETNKKGEKVYDVSTDQGRANRKKFMEVFAPRCGDRGVIPELDMKTMLTADIDMLSDIVAVTEDHFIDPDIFYYRDRDKQAMCGLAKGWTADDVKAEQEILSTGRTIQLPINFSDVWKAARNKLVDEGKMSKETAANYEDQDILGEISKLFTECITNTVGGKTTSEAVAQAQQAFSVIGVNELPEAVGDELLKLLDAVTTISEDPRLATITHLEFITQDGRVIGNVHQGREKGVPYDAKHTFGIGGSPIYYNPVDNMSFSLTPKDMHDVEKQQILHMEDLTDSVLKSFPTVRLYFIEEDRDQTHYSDDFYGFGDIIECSISSHIYDNDICTMKLANFSGLLSTQMYSDYDYHVRIKQGSSAADQPSAEETSKTSPTTNKVKNVSVVDEEGEKFLRKIMLRPGIHIMIKMGYGNNIDHLKTVFTGEIAEVKPGSIVEIIAQGYQTELHSQFGGFMEESWWENFGAVFEWGEYVSSKFNFLKIINFILLQNDGEAKRLLRGGMKHLGKAFSSESYQKGIWGDVNSQYDYADSSNDIRRIVGSEYETTEQFLADAQGEEFSWFDSLMEKRYFGFSGNDVTRNVYIASSNNTNINLTNEWLITNAPVIDSLREVVRYMPNFIATVVPYHQDATLFIGDPAGPYQYRRPTAREDEYNVKFNSGSMLARRDQNNFKDLNDKYNLLIKEVNKLNSKIQADIDYYNAKKIEDGEYTGENESRIADLKEILTSVYFAPVDIDVEDDIHEAIFENYFGLQNSDKASGWQYKSTSKEMCRFFVPLRLHSHGYRQGATWLASLRSAGSLGSILSLGYQPSGTSYNKGTGVESTIKDLTFKINGKRITATNINISYPLITNDSKGFGKSPVGRQHVVNTGGAFRKLEPSGFKNGEWGAYSAGALSGNPDSYHFHLDRSVFPNRDAFYRYEDTNRTVVIIRPMFGQVQVTPYPKLPPGQTNGEMFPSGDLGMMLHTKSQDTALLESLQMPEVPIEQYSVDSYMNMIFGYKKCMALVKVILDGSSGYVDEDITEVLGDSNRIELNAMPWNYKIFRDNHVLSSDHDLIANNIVATESDMWSAVGVRVPINTASQVQGIGEWGLFTHGIKEGGVERDAGVYKIDPDQEFGIYPSKNAAGINYQGRYPGPKDILETFTEINATSPNLAQNVFKFRLAQGLSKMYRGNLISIGRNIKPYDSIQIVDNVNLIYGKVMAERVIQNFSSINGWTTTIVPCGLTRVNSKQASLGVSAADKWMYFLSKGKTFKYISNALTIASLGTIGLGVRGTALFLAKGLPRTLSRIAGAAAGRGGPGALWAAARIPFKYGSAINRANLAAGSSFGLRFASHAKWAGGSFLGGGAASGTADIIHQFMNMNISQTVALKTGSGSKAVVHQPAHISILTYSGGPFMAGLEDPYESMTNHNDWAELYKDFEYGFREFKTRPDRGGTFDMNDVPGLEGGGE